MMKKKRIALLLTGILSMGLTGCSEEVVDTYIAPLTVRTVSPEIKDFATSGSAVATIEPGSRVTVIPGVAGEVEKVYVSLGDSVAYGALICTVDADAAITQRDNASDAVTRAYEAKAAIEESLLVKAPVSGYIQTIDVKKDHAVSASTQVAYLNNQQYMTVKVPFLSSLVDGSWVGQTANLTFTDTGETLSGTVTEIEGTSSFLYGNISVNYVTISVTNPGGIQQGRRVAAEIGGVGCSGDGSFENEASSPVMSGLTGNIETIFVNVGDYVNAGDTMFRVTNYSTDNQLLNANNNISDALDARSDANDLIADYRVTAPISGTVSDVYVKALDQIGGSSAVVEISTLDEMEVTFAVSETVVAYLSVGQEIEISSLSGDATGRITEISSVASSQTGLFTIKGQVLDENLLTGTNATVSYQDFIEKNALVIPFEAVQFIGDSAYVFVVEEDIAVKKEVTLSRYSSTEVIVIDGIDEKDRLISTWSTQLRGGLEVQEEGAHVSD